MAERVIAANGLVEVRASATSEPWQLDIDGILVSVASAGFGLLGQGLRERFPDIPFDRVDLDAVTSTRPDVVPLTGHVPPDETGLRWIALVNVRERSGRSAEGDPSLAAVRRAAFSGLVAAAGAGATRIGLPLLGAGVVGLPRRAVIVELWRAIDEFAAGSAQPVTIVVFDREADIAELASADAPDGWHAGQGRPPEHFESAVVEGDRPSSTWGFVVSVDTLGSQGPGGDGVLLNESIVLTSSSVANPAIPFFAIDSTTGAEQAEFTAEITRGDGEEPLVVLRLLVPTTTAVPGFTQLSPGARCRIVTRSSSGQVSHAAGVASAAEGGTLNVELLRSEDRNGVRAGSAVLVDGLIAGMVSRIDREGRPVVVALTEIAGQLATWVPAVRDAVWPIDRAATIGDPGDGTPVDLSGRAADLLRSAGMIAAARAQVSIGGIDIVLAAMVNAAAKTGDHSAGALYTCVPDSPPRSQRLQTALGLLGVPDGLIAVGRPALPPDDDMDRVVDRASTAIATASKVALATTGSPQVRQRHVSRPR